jgi:hypothetical protein
VGGTCDTHGRVGKNIQGLMGKTEGNVVLGRPRRRWEIGSGRILLRLAGGEEWFSWLRIGTGGGLL